MSCLLITYDLNQPGQNYPELYKKIESLGESWHDLDSTWLVSTSQSLSQATGAVAAAIDSTDSLLVIGVTGDSYSGRLTQAAWDWLAKHL